jgi:peptide methionine sulfoxide reductase MsrA
MFFKAEEYHQDYYDRNAEAGYCQLRHLAQTGEVARNVQRQAEKREMNSPWL